MNVNEGMSSERQMKDRPMEAWQRGGERREEDDNMEGQHSQSSNPRLKGNCQDLRHSFSITAIKAVRRQLPGAALRSHAESIRSD